MGRGRQKAKHTKVARDLKYYSPDTNYGALANELTAPRRFRLNSTSGPSTSRTTSPKTRTSPARPDLRLRASPSPSSPSFPPRV